MTTISELANQLPNMPQVPGVSKVLLVLWISAFLVLPVLSNFAQLDTWRRSLHEPTPPMVCLRTETSTSTIRRVVTGDRVSGTVSRTTKVVERCSSSTATANDIEACIRHVRRRR